MRCRTLAALACGALSEWRATLIVRESACLAVEHRRELDAELCAEVSRLDGWGNKRVEAEAKKIAARLDVQAVVDRASQAAKDRCVWIRPAPDTMAYVTALSPASGRCPHPVAQGCLGVRGVETRTSRLMGVPGGR